MNIFVNKELLTIDEEITLQSLVDKLKINTKYIAIEINMVIVPKSQYEFYIVKNKDRIEIINAVGGG